MKTVSRRCLCWCWWLINSIFGWVVWIHVKTTGFARISNDFFFSWWTETSYVVICYTKQSEFLVRGGIAGWSFHRFFNLGFWYYFEHNGAWTHLATDHGMSMCLKVGQNRHPKDSRAILALIQCSMKNPNRPNRSRQQIDLLSFQFWYHAGSTVFSFQRLSKWCNQ